MGQKNQLKAFIPMSRVMSSWNNPRTFPPSMRQGFKAFILYNVRYQTLTYRTLALVLTSWFVCWREGASSSSAFRGERLLRCGPHMVRNNNSLAENPRLAGRAVVDPPDSDSAEQQRVGDEIWK